MLIDKDATKKALDELCKRECQYSPKQRYIMCGACPLGSAFDVIENMPNITIAGYNNVAELNLFADVCRKYGIEDEDLKTFANNLESAYDVISKEINESIMNSFEKALLHDG